VRKYVGILLFVSAAIVISSPLARQQGTYVTVNSNQEGLDPGAVHNVSFSMTINHLGGLTYLSTTGLTSGPTTGGGLVFTTGGGSAPPAGGTTTETSSSSTGTSSTTGGGTSEDLIIANPATFVGASGTPISASDMQAVYHYPSVTTGGLKITVAVNDQVQIKHSFSTNPATSTSADVGIKWNSSGTHYIYLWNTYSMGRVPTTVVSVDSRKMYGSPNAAGEVPGDQRDANSPLHDVNFNNWVFRGGVFVGNSPFQSNDQSGTSRMQAYMPSDPTGNAVLSADLVLYYLQRPAGFTDNFTLSTYIPSQSDPNYSTPSTDLKWSKAWTISNPSSPFASMGTSTLTSPGPVNFNLNTSTTSHASKLIFAMNPEPQPGSTPQAWLYFGSPQYAATINGASDQGPRTWFVQASYLYKWTN